MGNAMYQCVLKDMRERAVSDIMHQNGGFYRFSFRIENKVTLLLK